VQGGTVNKFIAGIKAIYTNVKITITSEGNQVFEELGSNVTLRMDARYHQRCSVYLFMTL
jgi:hypothetical protein